MSIQQFVSLGKQTFSRWNDHNATRLGASVAFYSILSFAPLLIIITAVIALVFGNQSAHGALVSEARQVMGNHGAETVESLLKNAQKPASGIFASVIAFVTLLFGASGVFTELQDALNIMWDATQNAASGFIGLIKQRLFSFGMVLSIGFLLLVSLLISAALEAMGHVFGNFVPLPPFVLQAINFVFSFVVVTVLFALMFKYVPATHVAWRDVIVGAIGTALLFTIGKMLLAIYLAKATVAATYGAAGSLVAVVVWIYYSAQIFFFGAEFTRVYSETHGSQKTSQSKQVEKPPVAASSPIVVAPSPSTSVVQHQPPTLAPESVGAPPARNPSSCWPSEWDSSLEASRWPSPSATVPNAIRSSTAWPPACATNPQATQPIQDRDARPPAPLP